MTTGVVTTCWTGAIAEGNCLVSWVIEPGEVMPRDVAAVADGPLKIKTGAVATVPVGTAAGIPALDITRGAAGVPAFDITMGAVGAPALDITMTFGCCRSKPWLTYSVASSVKDVDAS